MPNTETAELLDLVGEMKDELYDLKEHMAKQEEQITLLTEALDLITPKALGKGLLFNQ